MSLAEANMNYFNNIGDAYDSKPWFAKVNQQVTDYLRARLDWVGIPFVNTESSSTKDVRLLDYACGPGLMSRIYGPYVTVTRGIDIAPKMVATYNARAISAGLPPSKIRGIVGDIFARDSPLSEELSTPEFWDFDFATVGFGFHHFEDVVHASRCLKERLRPGGVLLISDFLEGGDLKADENGDPVPGTEGEHMDHVHHHGKHGDHDHGHHEGQNHGHDQSHHHHHHHHQHGQKYDMDNPDPTSHVRTEMSASIVVPSFTIEGVKKFFTEAGLVDVEVITMEERVYMSFAGRQLWRTILFAKGRRPFEDDVKSEL
ncbi:S-adenosyl-L-methionine-dependent methyltransferase [Dendryphion nanum]|uniref:S-adenosyl-L-methionine-dependent methyltransferase n=1 Tax=Dendryphion nanum TaxID=256645 RepID=A0A9P9DDI4_9PLEO|nr:S-adenosyl-L-methionine-dependent methyltransferase [Dendryphion nanum]